MEKKEEYPDYFTKKGDVTRAGQRTVIPDSIESPLPAGAAVILISRCRPRKEKRRLNANL
jgi:hypothetical protein